MRNTKTQEHQRPEGRLIENALRVQRLKPPGAADKVGISTEWFRAVMNGYRSGGAGAVIPVEADAGLLAQIARALYITPTQLRTAGRDDAAQALVDMLEFEAAAAKPDDGEQGYARTASL